MGRFGIRGYASLVCTCAAMASAAVPAVGVPKSAPAIPKVYHGTWYEAEKACDDENQYPLEITATDMSSGEDSRTLVAVRPMGKGRIQIITKNYGELTTDSPPGSDAYTGQSRTTLILQKGGQRLKIIYQNGIVSDLKPCPGR